MNRSLSLLSAITLSSAALLSAQPHEASAMAIAFDCFERSTEKLVARSAVDMTSTAISCLPVPGNPITADSTGPLEHSDEYEQADWGDDDSWESEDTTASTPDWSDEDDDTESGPSIGSAIGSIVGEIIGQGLNDLFR